jgi:hypothetical protein
VARQPLTPSIGSGPVALALLASCLQPEIYTGAFDVPVAIAVVQPEVGGPFLEPVGLVANRHGGNVVPLALKQGRFLSEDSTVSFLRGNPIPTGALRLLASVAATAPSVDEITVWAGDERFGTLLRLPWILDCAAEPDRDECAADRIPGVPVEVGLRVRAVSAPDGLSLADLDGKRGYTATETWTITYDGAAWWVEGSRSGRQPVPAETGVWWSAEQHRLSFTVRDPQGRARAGDAFVVETDTGAREIDVGGAPVALLATDDQRSLAVIVERTDGGVVLGWLDPETELLAPVALPADAAPGRLTFAEDGALLVADRARPAVWEVEPGATTPAREHVLPWPVLDVAELGGVLHVTPLDGRSLWRVDRATGELLDTNPVTPGVQGLALTANVIGLEAIRLPYDMPEYDDSAIRRRGRSVGVSLSSGAVVFVHEDSGCLVQSSLGPRTVYDPNSIYQDYATSFDDVLGGPILEQNGASTRHVIVNDCAGIAPAEQWTLRYDEVRQGWVVTGSYSGEQRELAREDERYVSDEGQVSFLVRAGTLPSRDGWTIRFSIDSGVAAATTSSSDVFLRQVAVGVSGDLTAARWRAGLPGPIGDHEAGEGWYPVDLRTTLLTPAAATNEVGRVDPQTAVIDVGWE